MSRALGGKPVEDGLAALARELRGRVSYRQLDYWARNGRIKLADSCSGQGEVRRVTEAERLAIIDLVEYLEQLQRVQASIASGEFFAKLLARRQEPARHSHNCPNRHQPSPTQ